MNLKYYIATKEDKVGTVFAVAKYEDDEFRQVYINKISSNNMEGIEEIVKWIADKDSNKNVGIMSFKFKDIDTAKHIGNLLDKNDYYNELKNKNHCTYFASPAVFSKDLHKMHKAKSSLMSYLILREHYIKTGKLK